MQWSANTGPRTGAGPWRFCCRAVYFSSMFDSDSSDQTDCKCFPKKKIEVRSNTQDRYFVVLIEKEKSYRPNNLHLVIFCHLIV